MPTNFDDMSLPYGWVKQFDHKSGHPFFVDTKANPPRSIWVHPYQDEQFLEEHPDTRDKIRNRGQATSPGLSPPPSYSERRHSYGGRSSTPEPEPIATSSTPAPHHKRGFLKKLKDKATASLEERERRQQAALEQQRRYAASNPMYGQMYGEQPYGNQQYGAPSYGYPQRAGMGMGRNGLGGGGMAMPLIGGLAGGLLLGDMLGGGMGGGFGGGGFDGGFGGGGGGFGF